jgi:hypothetical protein
MVVVQARKARVAMLLAFSAKVFRSVLSLCKNVLLACLNIMKRPTLDKRNPQAVC